MTNAFKQVIFSLFRRSISVHLCHFLNFIKFFTKKNEIRKFYKKKVHIPTVPSIPTIIHDECSTVNNSVTVAWKALNPLSNDGYVLELDDGSGGEFRVC